MRILYLCNFDKGGITEYAIRQYNALINNGIDVNFICRNSFDLNRFENKKNILPILPCSVKSKKKISEKIFFQIKDSRLVAKITTQEFINGHYDALLISCYSEYFSPFWASYFHRCSDKNLKIGTIAHDPIRNFKIGPHWWHQWSIKKAYSFVSDVFVHNDVLIDFGGIKPPFVKIHKIPIGSFENTSILKKREDILAHYNFSKSDIIFLSFGQIRDGKNLDLFLKALVNLPKKVKLLVAGSGDSFSQHPPEFYIKLAKTLGVNDRCVWDLRYIPDEEISSIFNAINYVLITYSSKFRSASGVLSLAIASRRLVLASCGLAALQHTVEEYQLGVFVAPDNSDLVLEGVFKLIDKNLKPEWDRYEKDNSWQKNAEEIIKAFER